MQRLSIMVFACSLAVITLADQAWARSNCGLCDQAESQRYLPSASARFTRGAVNTLFGWTELFAQRNQQGRAHERVINSFNDGVRETLTRTLLGATELLTCWTPSKTLEVTHRCALGTMGFLDR